MSLGAGCNAVHENRTGIMAASIIVDWQLPHSRIWVAAC